MNSNINPPVSGINYTIPQKAIKEHNYRVNNLISQMQLMHDCRQQQAEHALRLDLGALTVDDVNVFKNIAQIQQEQWMWSGLIQQVEELQFCPPAQEVLSHA